MKYFLFSALFFFPYFVSLSHKNDCNDLNLYVPRGYEAHELEIKVMIHVVKKSENDPQNYTEKDTALIREEFDLVNRFYRYLEPPTLKPDKEVEFIPDTRIRFKIMEYRFHTDSTLWDRYYTTESKAFGWPIEIDSINYSTSEIIISGNHYSLFRKPAKAAISGTEKNNGWYETDTSYYLRSEKKTVVRLKNKLQPEKQKGKLSYTYMNNLNCAYDAYEKLTGSDKNYLHVIYTGGSENPNSFGCGPSPYFLNVSNFLKTNTWIRAQTLTHELGHCLGLNHTVPPQFDDMPRKDGMTFADCDSVAHSNNFMNYSKCKSYLSPKQIAFIHKRYNTDAALIATTGNCHYSPENSTLIRFSETWNRSYALDGDIVVKKNKTLTVNCKLSLAEGVKIYLENNASLVINGATITNSCGNNWSGIVHCRKYRSNPSKIKPATKRGKVELQNGGKLENVSE